MPHASLLTALNIYIKFISEGTMVQLRSQEKETGFHFRVASIRHTNSFNICHTYRVRVRNNYLNNILYSQSVKCHYFVLDSHKIWKSCGLTFTCTTTVPLYPSLDWRSSDWPNTFFVFVLNLWYTRHVRTINWVIIIEYLIGKCAHERFNRP